MDWSAVETIAKWKILTSLHDIHPQRFRISETVLYHCLNCQLYVLPLNDSFFLHFVSHQWSLCDFIAHEHCPFNGWCNELQWWWLLGIFEHTRENIETIVVKRTRLRVMTCSSTHLSLSRSRFHDWSFLFRMFCNVPSRRPIIGWICLIEHCYRPKSDTNPTFRISLEYSKHHLSWSSFLKFCLGKLQFMTNLLVAVSTLGFIPIFSLRL